MEILKQGLPSCQTGLRPARGLGGLTGPKAVRPAGANLAASGRVYAGGCIFVHRMDTPATSATRRLRVPAVHRNRFSVKDLPQPAWPIRYGYEESRLRVPIASARALGF